MSVFKKLAGDTALYGVSTILGRMLNFVLVPLQTYVFPQPGQLSSNVELYSYVGVLLVLYTLGLETAYFRYAARAKGDEAARQKALNDALSIVGAVSIVATLAIIALAGPIARALDYPGQQLFIVWVALITAIDAVVAIPFARLRVEGKAKQFVTAKIINITLVVALNVFFLIICRDIYAGKYAPALRPFIALIYNPAIGPGYIFLANLLGNATYFFLLRDAFRGFRFTWQGPNVRTLLVYAFPLMLTALAGMVNTTIDRIMLRRWLPDDFYAPLTQEDALGIYGNCFKLSVFMALAVQSFKFAADPFFFSQAEDKNAPDLLARVTKWFVIVCVLLWLAIGLNMDVVGLLISPRYRAGLDVVPLLLLANLFIGVYYNISFWFKLTDRTQFGTYITVIGLAVTVGLNWLLIPQIGYMGCAWAFLASSVVMTALCYVLGERFYPVPYNVAAMLGYIVAAGALIWASNQLRIEEWWLSVLFHAGLFALFLGVIVAVEWSTFAPVLRRRRSVRT